jgi:hypothetical protein
MKDGGWLSKYDDGGVQPNYNDADASYSEDYVGAGYDIVGRNYSPAWGGQFEHGGTVPGSVGFSYARTKGIPSNGPYAKKTKASAQNGKEISYDQWKKQYKLKETPDYNLKRAWELGYTPDKTGHLPTVDNQTGQFLKSKGHPTLKLELDWYNSPEGAEFKSKNTLDSTGKFFKYIPKLQNGKEMQFYQNGLDWKPKSISRDGSVIEDDRGQWDHPGEITKINSNEITMQGVDYPVLGVSDTGDTQMMQPGEDYTYDGNSVTEYPMMEDGGWLSKYDLPKAQTGEKLDFKALMNSGIKQDATKVVRQEMMSEAEAKKFKARKDAEELARRKQAIATSAAAKKKSFSAKQLAEETGAIGDKFRMFPNDPDSFIDEYINPGVTIGNMASGLGRIPLNIQEGDYGEAAMAVGTPLAMGALAGIGTKSTGQFVNNLVNPLAGTRDLVNNLDPELIQPILSNASNFGNKTKKFLRNNILTDKTFNRLETVDNFLNKSYRVVNPFHHSNAQKNLNKANEWMDDWYNDPITKEKIKEASSRFGPASYNEQQLLENIENKNYKSSFEAIGNKVDNFLDGKPRVHKGNYGVSGWHLDFYKDQSKRQNLVDKYIHPDMITSTAIHEGNHGLTNGNNLIRGYEDILHSPFDTENFKPRLNDGNFEKYSDYLLDPTEINARVSEIRYEHGLKPGENLTPERVDEIVNKGLFNK